MQTPAPDQAAQSGVQAKPTDQEERLADSRAIDKASKHSPDRCKFANVLPFLFVVVIISTIYAIYMMYHCLPMLQESERSELDRGKVDFVVVNVLTLLLVICYAMCILVHPGTVPNTPKWRVDEESFGHAEPGVKMHETKRTGERRYCKWCARYKPDRCHHCRICNVCVLRMDHHCPWVYNCIGFRNHKYFFLLLVYAVIDLIVVAITMFDTVWWSTRIDVPISMMIGLMAAQTLAAFLVVLITSFLSFHIWLLTKAMTTVEFCEKSLKKASYNSSQYSHGLYNNICAVLGPNPLLWFFPIGLPQGDGLIWPTPSGSKASSSGDGDKASGPRASLLEKDGDGNGAQHESASASAAAGEDEASSGPARGSSRKARGGASRSKPQAAG